MPAAQGLCTVPRKHVLFRVTTGDSYLLLSLLLSFVVINHPKESRHCFTDMIPTLLQMAYRHVLILRGTVNLERHDFSG